MTRRFSNSRLRRILLVLAPLTLLAAAPEEPPYAGGPADPSSPDRTKLVGMTCSLIEPAGATPVYTRDDDDSLRSPHS